MKSVTLLLALTAFFSSSSFGADSVAFSPDGSQVAIGLNNGGILLRDARTGDRLGSLGKVPGTAKNERAGRSSLNRTPRICFSPDGRILASASGGDAVVLWDVAAKRKLRDLPNPTVGYRLTFSPDGSRLVGVGKDGMAGPYRLTLWDTKSGQTVRSWTLGQGVPSAKQTRIVAVRFASKGNRLAIDCVEKDVSTVRVWESERGRETIVDTADSWSISPDGRTLVTRRAMLKSGLGDRITIWDARTGKKVRSLFARSE